MSTEEKTTEELSAFEQTFLDPSRGPIVWVRPKKRKAPAMPRGEATASAAAEAYRYGLRQGLRRDGSPECDEHNELAPASALGWSRGAFPRAFRTEV